jgi:hypothetical protein
MLHCIIFPTVERTAADFEAQRIVARTISPLMQIRGLAPGIAVRELSTQEAVAITR